MSEIKKNIETCRGEDVLAEVSGLPQDPHFGSLVNEALDPLKQQAAAQEGWDGYSEVIEQHKPYTFASFIVQMKSNLLLLLRALWQFPFGTGTLRSLSDDASLRSLADNASLRSLSDMWQHYITRLSGNETYGIPSRLSSLTDLPSAPLLVADRKISGVPEAADGMSLLRILCDSAVGGEITQLLDETTGWTMNRTIPSLFGTLTKIKLGCSVINEIQISTSAELIMDELKTVNRTGTWHAVFNYDGDKLSFPNLETINGNVGSTGVFAQGNYKELYIPKVTRIYDAPGNHGCFLGAYQGRDSRYLRKLVVGKLTSFSWNFGGYYNTGYDSNLTDFIHFEIGQDTDISLNCAKWSPTNALDASLDTLVTDEDCHNNLEQFLKNFRTYIALRLADNGSGKTLTLSQAVFSSIWDANGNPQVLQDGLDQLRADIHNIVKTTKHWDVNKAN